MSTCRRGLTLLVVVAFVASSLLTCGSPDTGPAGEEAPAAETEELAEVATVAPENTATEPAPAESQIPASERASDTPEPIDTPQATVETPTATPTATLAPGQPPPPSSTELIRQGLEGGEIDEETALVYEVFAAFSDSRLPEAYQGDDSGMIDSLAVARAVDLWDTLSPETRQLLTPFRLPPNAPGSWWELRHPEAQAPGNESASAANGSSLLLASSAGAALPAAQAQQGQWKTVWAVDGLIKVWYRDYPGSPEPQIATMLAMEIRTQIYPKLKQLMGRALLSDEGAYCLDRNGNPFTPPLAPPIELTCTGDDGALDIYLVPNLGIGIAIPYARCSAAPSFVLLDWGFYSSLRPEPLWSLAAHEMMHVFQNLYKNCPQYHWIAEATATWAEDYVYRGHQTEWHAAKLYLDHTDMSLVYTNGSHEYGAYLFFFYLTRRPGGKADLVRKVWENTTKGMDEYLAVVNAVPGDFDDVWHEFAVYNWNEPPDDHYKTWDGLQHKAAPYGGKTKPWWDILMRDQMGMGFLWDWGIIYKHYEFTGPDPRMVTFFNGLTWELKETEIDLVVDGVPIQDGSKVFDWEQPDGDFLKGLGVQALYRIEGEQKWHLKDLTDLPYISFCRDAKAERIEELVIIYSNAKFKSPLQNTAPQGLQPALLTSNIGCWRWEGEAKVEVDIGYDGSKAGEQIFTVSDVVWERDKTFPDIPYPYVTYHLVQGELEFEFGLADPDGCTGQGNDSRTLEPEEQAPPLLDVLVADERKQGAALQTFYGVTQGPSQRRYLGWGLDSRDLPVEVFCPDAPGGGMERVSNWNTAIWTGFWFPLTFWTFQTGQVFSLGNNGNRMQDRYHWDSTREDWDFQALRE